MKGEQGGGLIYFLILAAATSVILYEIQRRAQHQNTYLKIDKAKTVRNSILERLQSSSRSAEALFLSKNLLNNSPFSLCLQSGAGCTTIGPANMSEFSLVHPEGLQLAAGTQPIPATYTRDGEARVKVDIPPGSTSLIPTTSAAVFQGRSFFWAVCANNAPSCLLPERIMVIAQIKKVAGALLPADLADVPTDAEISSNRLQLAQGILVSDILGVKQACPSGSVLTEIDKKGKIHCECLGGSAMQTGLNDQGLPICQVKDCPPNLTYAGLDDQKNPICLTREKEFNCFRKSVDTTNNSIDCGKDSYGQPIRIKGIYNTDGACSVNADNTIACEPNEALCCVRRPEPL